jgi:hypothetical protein
MWRAAPRALALGRYALVKDASGLNTQRVPVALPAGRASRPPDPLQVMWLQKKSTSLCLVHLKPSAATRIGIRRFPFAYFPHQLPEESNSYAPHINCRRGPGGTGFGAPSRGCGGSAPRRASVAYVKPQGPWQVGQHPIRRRVPHLLIFDKIQQSAGAQPVQTTS